MRPRKIVPAGTLEHGEDGRLVCWDDPALQPSCHIFYGACLSGALLKTSCCGGECSWRWWPLSSALAYVLPVTQLFDSSPQHAPAATPSRKTASAGRRSTSPPCVSQWLVCKCARWRLHDNRFLPCADTHILDCEGDGVPKW
jgi:hypothetical protein